MTRTGILRTVSRYLNGASATGDAMPGVSNAGYAGQPPRYAGQLGAIDEMGFAEAQKRSDPAVTASMQGGRFQYVLFAADGTTYAQGQVLFWKDETNYIVTNVSPSAVSARVAGVCIAPVVQGNYWFVQVRGVAWGLYRATVSSAVADNGVYILVNTNTIDALADATADATVGVNKLFIGTAKDLPANGALGRIYLKSLVEVF